MKRVGAQGLRAACRIQALIIHLKHTLSVSARVTAYELNFQQRGRRGREGMGGRGDRTGAISAVLSRSRRGEEVQAGSSQNAGAREGSHSH